MSPRPTRPSPLSARPWRFSDPVMRNIAEILVTSPDAPVHDRRAVRQSDFVAQLQLFQSLTALNTALASAGKAPLDIHDAPEDLQDEDILEMLQSGLGPIHDCRSAQSAVLERRVSEHSPRAERRGTYRASIGWMVRKHSPLLGARAERFSREEPSGTSDRETLFRKYLTNVRYVKNATSEAELKKFEQVVGLFRKYAGQYDLDALLVMAQATRNLA